MTGETATTGLARLREPFPAEHVGLLPKVTCRDCSDRNRQCQKHERRKCEQCAAFISPAHIHLDYVGHGAVTDRLLEVDPCWNWEPLAFDQNGLPLFLFDKDMNPIELWIRLEILGHKRLGVGTCPSGQFDAAKVLIGDALRNAAMRFGVALDLWIKGHAEDSEQQTASDVRASSQRPQPVETFVAPNGETIDVWPGELRADLAKARLVEAAGGDEHKEAAAAAWAAAALSGRFKVTDAELAEALMHLRPSEAPSGAATPAALTPKVLAIHAQKVFTPAGNEAPKGMKTKWIDRLRHALVYACTAGKSRSFNDLDETQCSVMHDLLTDIDQGRVTFDHDETGVEFHWADGTHASVLWTDLEPEAGAA